jgi:2-oxoglutarate ferredoxin oxidoreductase subunit beta
MLHDGSFIKLSKVAEDYDATDRDKAYAYIRDRQKHGEIATGLLYVSEDSKDMHEQLGTIPEALTKTPYKKLCPGSAELAKLQERFR